MEQVKQTKRHRFLGWCRNNYALFSAPFLVALAYTLALLFNGVYPFGTKYTAASYDLSAQIAPFIEHLFDVFEGKSTLTFSYAIVGGADVTGTFLYFFISPFSLLFLLCGDGKVAYASSIVMLCKLATIAFAGVWFAKRLFQGIPEYLCLAVGVAYAYCGYTFVANTYINWMDFLIYLPFAAGAFVRFVKTGKFLRFSLLIACCVYTCFSIACFSMFTAFPALIAYVVLCVKKEERSKMLAYLCLAFLVALLMALPVLLPALSAYSVSGRGGSLFENLWKGFTVNSTTGIPEDFNSSIFLENYSTSLYRKWAYILADSAFVVLTLIWFVRKGLKDKFAQFMLVAGILTLLPTLVDESMNLLNMGSYMSYSLRFGFLNALYFLGGACLCLEGWCYRAFHAYDGESLLYKQENAAEGMTVCEQNEGGKYALSAIFSKKNAKPLLFAGGFILLGVLAVAFAIWFCYGENYLDFVALFGIDGSGFSPAFAHSLGGLEVIVVLFIAVGAVALVGVLLVSGKRISPRLCSFLLLALVCVQICFYNDQIVVGNRSAQHQTIGSYQALCEEFNEREEGYFRVKDYDDAMTACVPFTGGSNSFSVFSSVIDKDNFATFQLFGYKGNGKNTFKSAHNEGKGNRSDEFGDSFLGYKYFVSEKNDLHEQAATGAYVKPVYVLDEKGDAVLDENGKKLHLCEGGLYAYENTIVFPLGYKVQGSYTFAAANVNNRSNRKRNQQALYAFLRGKDLVATTGSEYVTPTIAAELSGYLHGQAAEVHVSAGKITAKVTAGEGESLFLNFVAARGYSVTVNGKKAALVENDLKMLLVELEAGENEVVFTYRSPYVGQALIGLVCGGVLLVVIWATLKRTKVVEKLAPVIAWAGVLLSIAVVVFFMLYPTCVFLTKLVELVKVWL